ncbi:hypothetical protein CTheo_5204 [Ceratobasidium theobromae]|uniref:Phosphatidylglycerol/phosphatidylinositol transfer protein n=1 Tax=Ceratobasidium theobromae TaxID=1582974 RepID=A0A5N5QIN2_9AGAM|nr:hypothetical protein CTheo_5204 [Ceratobasidium theobromae]
MLFRLTVALAATTSFISLGVSALVFTPQGKLMLPDEPSISMASWSYEDCGLPSDPLQILSIEADPEPSPGKNTTITLKANVLEPIEEGAYTDVEVKLGLIRILRKKFDICEEARKAKAEVQCPVASGSYVVKQTISLPREIPPVLAAKFTVKMRGYTVDDDDLACVDLKADFMKHHL